MDELKSLLRSRTPQVIRYSPHLFRGIDPVSWAVNFCMENSSKGLRLEAMKSAFAGHKDTEEDGVVHFSPSDQDALKGILTGIARGEGGHASLGLMRVDSKTNFAAFEPCYEFYRNHLMQALNDTYKLGHLAQATLWFSASKHIYTAHIDLEDGLLFQIAGSKRVKVWPLPDNFPDTDIYDHTYTTRYVNRPYRESLPYDEYELHAGEVLMIPGGAVHEVTTDAGHTSLSMSFHVGCAYPVNAVVDDLKETLKGHELSLPKKYSGSVKPTISLINQKYICSPEYTGLTDMPASLRDSLHQIIQSDLSTDTLDTHLNAWWSTRREKPTFTNPFEYITKPPKLNA